MESFRKKLGLRIRQLRKHQHLTQEQLAEESGISTDFVSRVERGHNIPSLERINAMTKALDVTLAEFFLPIDPPELDPCSLPSNEIKQLFGLLEKLGANNISHLPVSAREEDKRIHRIRALP